jgi:hypothetical protein
MAGAGVFTERTGLGSFLRFAGASRSMGWLLTQSSSILVYSTASRSAPVRVVS